MVNLQDLGPHLENRRYPPFYYYMSSSWLRDFAKISPKRNVKEFGNGDTAPNAIISCCRHGEFHVFKDLGISLKQLLHTSQKFNFFEALKTGQWLKSEVEITKCKQKVLRGQLIVILEVLNQYYHQDQKVADTQMSVFVRPLNSDGSAQS